MNDIRFCSTLAFLLLLSMSASSCMLFDSVRANGDVKTETRPVDAFSSVALNGSGALRVHRGAQDVEITADSNVLPYIETTVANSRLSIGIKPFTSVWGSPTFQFDVTMPILAGLELNGSGEADADAFSGDAFVAKVTGSGSLAATLDYSSAVLDCSGSGGATLSGSSDETRISISGSGTASAKGLGSKKAIVSIAGSGNVELRAIDALDVSLYGSGDLRYWGSPALTQSVTGSGRVSRAGD